MKKRTCSNNTSTTKAVVVSSLVSALFIYIGLHRHITARAGNIVTNSINKRWENHTLDATQVIEAATRGQEMSRLCSQTERLQILEETCARRNLTPVEEAPFKQIKNLLVDDRHKLIYCGAAKAGSSAWLKTLIEASGKPLPNRRVVVHSNKVLSHYGLRRLAYYSEREIKHRLETYFKFIVIRHPFERVVSAWYDKFIMPDGPYQKLGRKIAEKYKIDRSEYQNSTNATYWNTRAFFVEFARHLLETHKQDPHWKSFDRTCNPCAVKWDAIIKVESMNHDSALIIDKFGRDYNMTSLPVMHSHQDRATLIHFEKKLDQMDGIRSDVLQYLFAEYGHDLAMFGYSWNPDKLLAKCGQEESETACC